LRSSQATPILQLVQQYCVCPLEPAVPVLQDSEASVCCGMSEPLQVQPCAEPVHDTVESCIQLFELLSPVEVSSVVDASSVPPSKPPKEQQ
jgi:hypothetical protein